MKRSYTRKPASHQQLARERITELFSLADAIFTEDSSLANRYVALARKMGMKYKVRIPPEFRSKHCKNCHVYLRPGVNSRVRLQEHKLVIYCQSCKHFMHIPYTKTVTKKKANN
jgi:ribonuclease P protein subunit RPR2